MLKDGTFFWLSCTKGGSPLYRGGKLWLSLPQHDTLLKVIYFIVLWVLCVVAQILSIACFCVLYAPIVAVHIPLWTVWLLLGAYLLQIKMLSVGRVWTIYFRVWLANDNRLDSKAIVDTTLMNHALLAEFLTETLPQLLIQGTTLIPVS